MEYPQYTRPREFKGHEVPETLLSGDHKRIDEWRHYESLKATYIKRPDMIEARELSEFEKKMLEKIKKELKL